MIRPNCQTFCCLCSSGIELKNLSSVQRTKYDTIVNINRHNNLTFSFQSVCNKKGAVLAEIENQEEHAYLEALLRKKFKKGKY